MLGFIMKVNDIDYNSVQLVFDKITQDVILTSWLIECLKTVYDIHVTKTDPKNVAHNILYGLHKSLEEKECK